MWQGPGEPWAGEQQICSVSTTDLPPELGPGLQEASKALSPIVPR